MSRCTKTGNGVCIKQDDNMHFNTGLDLQACLLWWGWTHRGTVCHLPECRHRSGPEQSSRLETAGMRTLKDGGQVIKPVQCVSTIMLAVLTDLWVENRTCSQPCGASQQSSDQICGNWQWFHLNRWRNGQRSNICFSCCADKQHESLPSSMSGGSPPTNTLREKRSTRSPLRWGKQWAEPRPASPWSPDSSSPKERSSSIGNKDEWPAENDYVSRLTEHVLTLLNYNEHNVIRCGKIKYIKQKHSKAAMIAIWDTKFKGMSRRFTPPTQKKKRLELEECKSGGRSGETDGRANRRTQKQNHNGIISGFFTAGKQNTVTGFTSSSAITSRCV